MRWTVEDEINLIKWVDNKGFRIVYIPEMNQWGYFHIDKPYEINSGYDKLVELKRHLADLKGVAKDVCIILPKEVHQTMAQARRVLNFH